MAAALAGGCATGQHGGVSEPRGPLAPETFVAAAPRPTPPSAPAAHLEPLGEPVARPREPLDPGAERLVDRLLAGLEWMALDVERPVFFGLRLTNQSHAGAAEFDRLGERLAEAITRAGERNGLVATADRDVPVDVEITGAAYLATWAGFEQWELYLRMRPARQASRQWQFGGPVRVMRHPRGGLPEIWVEDPDAR